MEDAAQANIEMMKVALNLNESDDESIVSSKGGSDSGEEERDLLKALAQRATDPYIKARKAKGPFVYVKPRLRPGRHIYIDEEIQRTQDAYAEEQLRQKLKGAQYRITGLVKFDKHGQAKGFEVQEVAAAISSAVRAVLQEERATTGGSLQQQHPSHHDQLDTDFASKVAERAAWSDPVFEEAVRAARSQAFTTHSSAMPPPPTSPSAQVLIGPSTAQGLPAPGSPTNHLHSPYPLQPSPSPGQPSSPYALHLQQPPPSSAAGWGGLQSPPSGTPSPSLHLQQPPPSSAPPWGGPHQGAQILNLEQSRPPTTASLSASPSFAPVPLSPELIPGIPAQQQQQQQLPGAWEGYSHSAGHTSHHLTSPFLQQQGAVEQHAPVPLDSKQHQDFSSPYLHPQGWTQGEGYGAGGIERNESRNEDRRYPRPDTRGALHDYRGFDHSREHRGYNRGAKGACHDDDDGRAHGHERHAHHNHSRRGHVRRSSSSRERHRRHRHHRHRQGSRDKYQADGMRRGGLEGDGRQVRALEEGRYGDGGGAGGRPRGHRHSSRRERKKYEEEGYHREGVSRREDRRKREEAQRVGGKEGHRRHQSRPAKDDRHREHRHSSKPRGAAKDSSSKHRQPESRQRGDDRGARSRDVHYSSSKDAYRRPGTSTLVPRTAATSMSKAQAKKQPVSDTDSQASEDSRFPGLESVLQSEEAAVYLRPAVSNGSEAEPNPDAPPRNPTEVKARLHGDPKARLMREARKERWTSSDDDGNFGEYVRQSKVTGKEQ